jgi:phosphatidylglycerophosphatase A
MIKRMAHEIAACGWVGRLPYAPGTCASLVSLAVIFLISRNSAVYLAALCLFFAAAVWASSVVSRETNQKDPQFVVLDEVVGMLVTFAFVPFRWSTALSGFILFRLFDIMKPPPLRAIERLPNGFGIVLDDFAAGMYANLILQLLIRYANV